MYGYQISARIERTVIQRTTGGTTLDYRQKRFDIIQVFEIIHKIDDIDMNVFFSFAENTQLRGHNLKLKKPRAYKSVRANSFALRNIPVWNSLPT